MTRKRVHPITVQNEGQRLLLAREETPAAIAGLVGVPPQRIDTWRSGRVRPAAESARLLRDALGIPLDAWTRVPGAAQPAPLPPALAPKTAIAEIDVMLAAVRVASDGLTERERAKRSDERIRLLRLKAQLERDERMTEDAIVRAHPAWKRIREALRTTLVKHPAALADVAAALSALAAWDDASTSTETEAS